MYLFDTDTLSNLMKPSPSDKLLKRMRLVSVGNQFTSSITLGELLYGARKNQSQTQKYLSQIEQLVIRKLPILPFDSRAAGLYAEVRSELERQGSRLEEPDLRIAAIALVRNLTIVTGNIRHFQRVPNLAVENWL